MYCRTSDDILQLTEKYKIDPAINGGEAFMEILLFVIFLFGNLITVLICRYAYGKPWEYTQGMLFGVHVPAAQIHQEEIEYLCNKSKNRWKIFQNGNLVFGVLICFICLSDFETFLIIYLIWILQYVAGIYYLIVGTHRKMYAVKRKHHWLDERSRRTISGVECQVPSGKREIHSWPHVLILILLLMSVVWLVTGNLKTDQLPAYIYWGTTVGMSLLFLGFHRWIIKKSDTRYSALPEYNQLLNQRNRRAWSVGAVCADLVNLTAWLGFLAGSAMLTLFWGIVICTILELVSVAGFLAPVLREAAKRRRYLTSDVGCYDVDDDEYWKNGWYSNPDDPHLLVQDRMSSTNFTFNMARPAAKIICTILTLVIVVTLIGTAVILFAFQNAETKLVKNGNVYTFSSVWYHSEFEKDEIEEIQLIDQLPEDSYTKVNGGATDEYSIGHFRGSETGTCMMYLKNDASPILEIQLDEEVIYANSSEPEKTREWYAMIVNGR